MTEKKSHLPEYARRARSSCGGFTLIETGMVSVAAGVLLVSGIALVKSGYDKSVTVSNKQRLNAIHQALANYETQNNRLPCPSSFIAKTSDKAFGHEINYSPTTTATGCGTNPATGTLYYTPDGSNTFSEKGRTGATDPYGTTVVTASPIIIGALPVRDLGLPDIYRTDTYGYMYTYAVTQSETTTLNSFAGAIDVVESNGNSTLPYGTDSTSKGTALYVVVDHGKDGKGGYIANSTATAFGTAPKVPCKSISPGAPGMDLLNCSFEAGAAPAAATPFVFRSVPYSINAGAGWFDDLIVYDATISTSTQACRTIYSTVDSTGVTPVSSSQGYYATGPDSGSGWLVWAIGFAFWFGNSFSIDNHFTYYNHTASTVDAYCVNASYNLLTGGCTQTSGPPVLDPATGQTKNAYGADVNDGGNATLSLPDGSTTTSKIFQIAMPASGHPASPRTDNVQGWECNGASAVGIQTQAYAVCCPSNGG